MQKPTVLIALLFAFLWVASPVAGQTSQAEPPLPTEFQWPREIETPKAKILIYQPQIEEFEGHHLGIRFAASVQSADMEAPEFGAVWVKARVEAQRDERMVRLEAIESVQSRFPDATPENQTWFANVLKKEIPTWDIVLSIDQIASGLEVTEERLKTEQALDNRPPMIIYSNKPAALVMVDGDPILEAIENTDLMAVVNTPYPIVFRKADKTYYLIGKETWYRANSIATLWQEAPNPPADIAALEREASDDEGVESTVATGTIVYGATAPTEILATDGEPRFVPFAGNRLMYVENTDNDLLYEVDSGKYYVLFSGRWYSSKKLDSGWAHVPPEKVPATFADITPDSKKADLRASVPGTEEARDAVMEAQIPQTAAIKRSEAQLTVEYDGEPQFKRIQGTRMDYAINTATPVIRSEGKYFAVDNGVWFTSAGAKGPWVVADAVPAEIKDIPPSSPVNHVKYVYIYDSTPEVVYVGYTPGYTGCYIHHGVVVYGSGYYYRPWYRHYYYPRHMTYGFGVHYSSYHGWSFGMSIYHGPFTFYFGRSWGPPRYGGWWGPPRYRPPYYRPPHYRPPRPRPPGHRPPGPTPPVAKPPKGGKPAHLPAAHRPNRPSGGNLYDKRPDHKPAGPPGTADVRPKKSPGKPSTLPNNVYTDRQGNLYRENKGEWEQLRDRKWQRPTESPGTPSQKPAQRPGSSVQKPTQRPSGPAQKPTQRPSGPTQKPAQRPSDSVQKPTQKPSGSNQRPAQQPGGSVQKPTQRPSGSAKPPTARPPQYVDKQPAPKPTPSVTRQQPSHSNRQQSLNRDARSRNRGNQRTQRFQHSR